MKYAYLRVMIPENVPSAALDDLSQLSVSALSWPLPFEVIEVQPLSDEQIDEMFDAAVDALPDDIRPSHFDLALSRAHARLIESAVLTTNLVDVSSSKDRVDAERYRWLRHGDNDEVALEFSPRTACGSDDVWMLRNEVLDFVIDDAMRAQHDKKENNNE